MDAEKKVELIKDFAEEIVTEDELRNLFETNSKPVAYDGFEPSGIAPIHFGLLRATNLKNMLKAGVKFKLWLADYFAFINNKLSGRMTEKTCEEVSPVLEAPCEAFAKVLYNRDITNFRPRIFTKTPIF